MAERIVSPGVFTNEVDQSFLAGGVAQIGAAIVGPTVKGPALIPTQITSYGQFENIFGGYTDDVNSYVPYVVQDYLRNGNVITVTRLLYENGYKLTNGALAIVASSGSVNVVTHVLHPVQAVTTNGASNVFQNSIIQNGTSGSFAITVSGSFSVATGTDASAIGFNGSFNVSQATAISASIFTAGVNVNNYISNVFTTNPKSTAYPVYVIYENRNANSLFNSLGAVTVSLQILSNYEMLQDYNTASTPWIMSQKIGSIATNLFKLHTLSHGTSVNSEVKVGIRDIQTSTEVTDPNGYPTFTVVVRKVNTANIPNTPYASQDTDAAPDVVETYVNCNLNPSSPNYIARKIGNQYQTINDSNQIVINGEYANLSRYIRVEVTDAVANKAISNTLFPFGFRAVNSPIPMVSGTLNLSAATYKTSQDISGVGYSSNNYFGFDFTATPNLAYLAPVPTSGSTTGSNSDFDMGNITQDASAGFPTIAPYSGSLQAALTGSTFTTNVAVSTRKFIVPFQGGFDGARPNLPKYSGANISATNTFGFDCSSTTSTGTVAYNKAFTLLSNTDYYDMNMLLTPGIIHSIHPAVTSLARNLAEMRQDTFYVMDSNVISDSIATVATQLTTLDSNYTAAYWPWVQTPNVSNGAPIFVPPSVKVPGALAFNDKNSAPWYAPAGLNRGILTASDTKPRLTQSDRDTLYQARINPIAFFVNEGVCVWGQKTLQARPSALDRVNVRRLLIAVKKFIASSTRYLVFEQNTDVTRSRFLNIVNPYMESVRANQGLYAFRVIMDQTNNTPDLVDQNILYGQIFLQPTRTAEFIVLDFNIQPTGAAFGSGPA